MRRSPRDRPPTSNWQKDNPMAIPNLGRWARVLTPTNNESRYRQPRPCHRKRCQPCLESLEDRITPAVVGYIDDLQFSTGDANYIRAAGHTPVQLFDQDQASYNLHTLDALIIGAGK